jgi:hypothetical protein
VNTTVISASQDYPLLNLFWTMFMLFIWILWIFLLIRIFSDIFRSADLNGWGKAGWSIFVIFLPFLGVFMYLILRGNDMHKRDVKQVQAQQDQFKTYVQQTAGTSSSAEELTKLAALRDQGVLTDAEFADSKAKVLAG